MALMYGAIGIGIVMISLGLILNIINRFRRGDVMGVLLDKFGVIGALFYWGVLALIANFAPNGRLLLYATEVGGRGILASASVDGRVRTRLTGPSGDIREPTWGPFIK